MKPFVFFFESQREGDILEHRQVRKKCIALEYRIDMAHVRWERQDACAVEPDVAGRRIVETGDEA